MPVVAGLGLATRLSPVLAVLVAVALVGTVESLLLVLLEPPILVVAVAAVVRGPAQSLLVPLAVPASSSSATRSNNHPERNK